MTTLPRVLAHVLRKTKRILLQDGRQITRLGLVVGSLFWGRQLLLPATLFPTEAQLLSGTGRTTYALMARVAPEEVWGFLFLFHALYAGYALFSGVRDNLTLMFDAFLGCLLWTGSTVACYVAYWPIQLPFLEAVAAYVPPAAMSGEAIMAFYSWWHFLRHWAEDHSYSSFYELPGGDNGE